MKSRKKTKQGAYMLKKKKKRNTICVRKDLILKSEP